MWLHTNNESRREFLGWSGGVAALLSVAFGARSSAQGEAESLLPSSDQLRELASQVDDGPVTMLNLMKVKPGESPRFASYSRAAGPIVRKGAGSCSRPKVSSGSSESSNGT